MNTLTLAPVQKQMYQVNPQNSHPKLSIIRVLYVRFLRWLDKASSQAIWKTTRRLGMFLLVCLVYMVPQFAMGFLLAVLKWNSFKIPVFCGLLCITLNWRRLLTLVQFRKRTKPAGVLYHGLPASELSSFLKETQAFKKDDVMKTFGVSEDGWKKIAEELELKGVLTRGEKNARVLRPISYVNLVRQISEKFPLVWDEVHEIFVERDGQYARHLLAQEFKTRKLSEDTARKERKLERLQEKIVEARANPVFAQLGI